MPEIPVRALQSSGGTLTLGWKFYPYRVPPTTYGYGTSNTVYTPLESYDEDSAQSWFLRSPLAGAPFSISASGVTGDPIPTITPSQIITLSFGDTDFEDVNDNDFTGFFLGDGGLDGSSNYRSATTRWNIIYGWPVMSAIAEVVKTGSGLEFYAVALTRRWPFNLNASNPSAENPIVKFLFDFGDSVQTTEEISTAGSEGGEEYYRGGPVLFDDVPDGEEFQVRIRAMDSLGAVSNWAYVTIAATESDVGFGSIIDRTGTIFSAVKDGDNVQVSRFPAGASSRELRAQILNASNPSYTLDKTTNTHYVSYADRSTGAQMVVKSVDGGRTWQ